jgi:hypothetical protein
MKNVITVSPSEEKTRGNRPEFSGSAVVENGLEIRQIPIDEAAFDLLHGNALGFGRPRVLAVVTWVAQPGFGAAAKLFRSERRYVNVKKTAFNGRSGLAWDLWFLFGGLLRLQNLV